MDVQVARDRLERAGEQLHSICDELDRYVDPQNGGVPFEFFPEGDPANSVQFFRVRVYRRPPRRIGILVGEFTHNLHSTLDNLMWAYFVSKGLPTDNRLYFPIYTEAGDFEDGWGKRLRLLDPDARALIEEVQPFQQWKTPRGDAESAPLAMVRRLSNLDKHRKPTLAVHAVPSISVAVSSGEPPLIQVVADTLEDGDVVARVDFTNCDLDMNIRVQFDGNVVLNEWGPISWTPLAQLMITAHEFVNHRVIDPFSHL